MLTKLQVFEFLNYKVYRNLIGNIPRWIYGNDAGFFHNASGRKALRDANPESLHVKNLLNNGFSVLGNKFHEKNVVQSIVSSYSKAIQEIEGRSPDTRKVCLVEPLLGKVPEVKNLFGSELRNILDGYYGKGNWRVSRAEAWRNYFWDVPLDKQVFSDLMHNDYESTETLRLFIYLGNGVTQENGATKLLSITDTKSVMRRGYFTRNTMTKFARKFINNKTLYMEGDTGYSFIFNPQMCLHAAGRVKKNGTRDVLVLSFRKATSAFSDENFNYLLEEQKSRFERGLSIEWT